MPPGKDEPLSKDAGIGTSRVVLFLVKLPPKVIEHCQDLWCCCRNLQGNLVFVKLMFVRVLGYVCRSGLLLPTSSRMYLLESLNGYLSLPGIFPAYPPFPPFFLSLVVNITDRPTRANRDTLGGRKRRNIATVL